MDRDEMLATASRMRQIVIAKRRIDGTAGELLGQFGYTELRPDLATYLDDLLECAALGDAAFAQQVRNDRDQDPGRRVSGEDSY